MLSHHVPAVSIPELINGVKGEVLPNDVSGFLAERDARVLPVFEVAGFRVGCPAYRILGIDA